MQNSILAFVLVLLLSQACNKEEIKPPTCEDCNFTCLDVNETDIITNECIENWECSFKLSPQSKVDLGEAEGIASGNKNVFQIINSTLGDEGIADDEFTNILVFELEESQNSFSVDAEDLNNMKVHFRRICFCAETDFKEVTAGCLEGEKQSDETWFIQGHITISYASFDLEMKFEAQFVD